MGNPRYIKVAEQIKVIVAELLERRIKDPRLGDFVTVTDVRLTGDGREATVFYTVLGGEEQRAGTAAARRRAGLEPIAVPERMDSEGLLALPELRDVRGIAFTEFQKEDVVRHPLVARIVSAYEAHTAALEAKLNDK